MLKYLLALITFSLIVVGCGEKNNQPEKTLTDKDKYSFDSTDLKTEGIDNSGKPFLMEYKFKKGDKSPYRLTIFTNNTQIDYHGYNHIQWCKSENYLLT